MVDVRNRNELELWLKTQPREVISIFAVRTALRVFPAIELLNSSQVKLRRPIPDLILPLLWGTSTALSSGTWPNRTLGLHDAADAAAYTATVVLDAANEAIQAADDAYDAAFSAAYAAIADATGTPSYAADAYAVAVAIAPFPGPEQKDVDFIIDGGIALDLAQQKLWWAETVPADIAQNWKALKTYLHAQNQNWEVWTQWYDDRLKGDAALIEAIEIGDPDKEDYGRITFPKDWYRDPAKLNAALKAKIDNYWAGQAKNSDIPTPAFASIRTIWKKGKLYIDPKAIDSDLEAKLATANLLALKDEIESFASTVEKSVRNFDNSYADLFTGTAVLITGDLPDSRTVFRLMKRETMLLSLEKAVLEQWPDALAAQYSALCTDLTDALDMFPDIRAFKRQQSNVEMEGFDSAEIEQDINQRIEVMRSELGQKIIDGQIPDNIQDLGLSKTTDPVTQNLETYDRLESANNVMKELARLAANIDTQSLAQAIDQGYIEGFSGGLIDGSKEAGKNDGKKSGKALARARATNAVGRKLSEKYPKRFGWIKRLPWNK